MYVVYSLERCGSGQLVGLADAVIEASDLLVVGILHTGLLVDEVASVSAVVHHAEHGVNLESLQLQLAAVGLVSVHLVDESVLVGGVHCNCR